MDRPDAGEFEREATLCYVRDGEELLLIRKKRGIGEGFYNGPGGKIEDHDGSPKEAAVRETVEETGVRPHDPEKVGELDFIFGEDPFQRVHVFITDSYEGTPEETEEAEPVWLEPKEMPYDEMWEDDRYWMPLLFEGLSFRGLFTFDEEGDDLQSRRLADGSF
jgi:8-oxo-dGTP diphosphatase